MIWDALDLGTKGSTSALDLCEVLQDCWRTGPSGTGQGGDRVIAKNRGQSLFRASEFVGLSPTTTHQVDSVGPVSEALNPRSLKML